MEKTDIRSLNEAELSEWIKDLGEKPFRAKQLFEWLHKHGVDEFDAMTNLPSSFRSKLKEEAELGALEAAEILTSAIDGTQKYLFRLSDGHVIESVLMHYRHGNSVCISTQVGCRMGCRFCASTIGGRIRNLTASEMLGQIYKIQNLSGERVSHVVLMGTGEPLDNYDNVLRFLSLITNEKGMNLSQRNITLSTCGIVENIYRLADEKLQITLALSLHASSQERRKELMPIANKYDLSEVLTACKYYFEKTGRRLTFEYSLVQGVNDSKEDADRLCALIGKLNCHVNLIPVNPVTERAFTAPTAQNVQAFCQELSRRGLQVTVRREMGRDISGACGQLRRSYIEKETAEGCFNDN